MVADPTAQKMSAYFVKQRHILHIIAYNQCDTTHPFEFGIFSINCLSVGISKNKLMLSNRI